MQETWVLFLSREDPLEKEKATHSSILARQIPWTEEPVKVQSMGSKIVGHDFATKQQQQSIYMNIYLEEVQHRAFKYWTVSSILFFLASKNKNRQYGRGPWLQISSWDSSLTGVILKEDWIWGRECPNIHAKGVVLIIYQNAAL